MSKKFQTPQVDGQAPAPKFDPNTPAISGQPGPMPEPPVVPRGRPDYAFQFEKPGKQK